MSWKTDRPEGLVIVKLRCLPYTYTGISGHVVEGEVMRSETR